MISWHIFCIPSRDDTYGNEWNRQKSGTNWFTMNRLLLFGNDGSAGPDPDSACRSESPRGGETPYPASSESVTSLHTPAADLATSHASVPTTPGAHLPLAARGHFPDENEPEWAVPWPPSVTKAQEMHNRMLQRVSSQFREMERLLDVDSGWNALMTSPTMDMRDHWRPLRT